MKRHSIFRKITAICLVLTIFIAATPTIFARDSGSTRKGTSLYPLYWTAYEPCFTADAPLDEARWKANIDWVADKLLPYGYNMVTTDGWLGGSTQTTENGYLLKYNDNWEHDWQYWADYCNSKGLEMGVYYNPLWIIDSVRDDPTKTIIGTNIPVQDIYTAGFADVTKEGAKEYIQGYVNYFKNMGVRFLRVDFLCWFETGAGSAGAPEGVPAWGSENYAKALRWITEAAGDDMEISLVMPNSFNHAANEVLYGDMMRVDTDTTNGDWTWLNAGSFGDERQTWNDRFCQWANPFQGLTGFSDIGGRGNLTLDGDFLRIQNFTGAYADNEKRSAISLFTMAGSPLAVASQYDTIGDNLSYLTNPEILALKKDGFVGKPIYYNGSPFEPSYSGGPDTGSRDSERWIGQTSNGDWVVALFNRSNTTTTKSIDFKQILGISGGSVHDIWNHTNLGYMASYTATLAPHDVSLVIITPDWTDTSAVRYEAEVASFRNGAHFNNDHTDCSGNGFVDRLSGDYPGSNVLFGVNAPYSGMYTVSVGYANATGATSTAQLDVRNVSGEMRQSATVQMPALSSWNDWGETSVQLPLQQGLNLITITRRASDTGAFNLDYIDVKAADISNPGFEAGNLNGWIATGSNCGVDASDVYSGNYKCYFWSDSSFTQRISQTFSLPNGTYLVSATVKQYSGTPEVCRMELSGFGGTSARYTAIPHGNEYTPIYDMVTVTNGSLNLAFFESAGGSANLQIDNVKIIPCGTVDNFGFETGNISGWSAAGSSLGVDNSDVYQGNYKCYFWNSGSFSQKVEQIVTGLGDGLHTVTVWVKQSSGSPSVCQMELSDYGGEPVYSKIPYSSDYMQISGTVYVINGQVKVTFEETGTGCNLQIDCIVIK
ncbi:Carbohydrate binding module (family 6) [Lachnospiraceae bacterium NK3A20]|nr:Carbohydrate binding module (family 6) [Lachnospiraceae bacterium NK3A20]